MINPTPDAQRLAEYYALCVALEWYKGTFEAFKEKFLNSYAKAVIASKPR